MTMSTLLMPETKELQAAVQRAVKILEAPEK